jgi:hypothetical protein
MTGTSLRLAKYSWAGLSLLTLSFRAHSIFFVIPALFWISNAGLFSLLEKHGRAPLQAVLFDLVAFSLPAGLLSIFVLRLVQYALVEKPASPALAMLRDIRELFACSAGHGAVQQVHV